MKIQNCKLQYIEKEVDNTADSGITAVKNSSINN